MRVITKVSALCAPLLILIAQGQLFGKTKASKMLPELLITECAGDGFEVWIPYSATRDKIAEVANVDLEAGFSPQDEGANFWFVREKKDIFKVSINDLFSGSVWIAIDHDRRLVSKKNEAHIAISYSDGGAIGGFHVRVFLIDGKGVRDVSKSVDTAVADFRRHHYCEPRGNNVTALKWIRGSLLLLTEVYPTGDCGSEAGHIEGYLVSVPEGKILEHMTLNQLKHYPGVCLENDDEN